MNAIENYHEKRKIIITTHHIGLFAILFDWLLKGEKAEKYKKVTKGYILSSRNGELSLETLRDDVLLYHLRLLQLLRTAIDAGEVCASFRVAATSS